MDTRDVNTRTITIRLSKGDGRIGVEEEEEKITVYRRELFGCGLWLVMTMWAGWLLTWEEFWQCERASNQRQKRKTTTLKQQPTRLSSGQGLRIKHGAFK
ncbi:predicted protein [Histoplasma capsulatum G186AR]|uniref:Uncharacterized protein n=1 Tax=Ajellomyces capsulatus (strain G186AR / H82 / ATCC MYA-2454 / RMSCC 2432) TaxID=447093 RepID=C0NGA2_AJECG|nr:uncharacterized protein HCBG_01918 [Histoplasma capsulatum G186AR]EEH10273.1 predicted protein [Histoplasma capsulatum G186AR]